MTARGRLSGAGSHHEARHRSAGRAGRRSGLRGIAAAQRGRAGRRRRRADLVSGQTDAMLAVWIYRSSAGRVYTGTCGSRARATGPGRLLALS